MRRPGNESMSVSLERIMRDFVSRRDSVAFDDREIPRKLLGASQSEKVTGYFQAYPSVNPTLA